MNNTLFNDDYQVKDLNHGLKSGQKYIWNL